MLIYLVLEHNTIIAACKRKDDADTLEACDPQGRRIVTIPASWAVILNDVARTVYEEQLARGH